MTWQWLIDAAVIVIERAIEYAREVEDAEDAALSLEGVIRDLKGIRKYRTEDKL